MVDFWTFTACQPRLLSPRVLALFWGEFRISTSLSSIKWHQRGPADGLRSTNLQLPEHGASNHHHSALHGCRNGEAWLQSHVLPSPSHHDLFLSYETLSPSHNHDLTALAIHIPGASLRIPAHSVDQRQRPS